MNRTPRNITLSHAYFQDTGDGLKGNNYGHYIGNEYSADNVFANYSGYIQDNLSSFKMMGTWEIENNSDYNNLAQVFNYKKHPLFIETNISLFSAGVPVLWEQNDYINDGYPYLKNIVNNEERFNGYLYSNMVVNGSGKGSLDYTPYNDLTNTYDSTQERGFVVRSEKILTQSSSLVTENDIIEQLEFETALPQNTKLTLRVVNDTRDGYLDKVYSYTVKGTDEKIINLNNLKTIDGEFLSYTFGNQVSAYDVEIEFYDCSTMNQYKSTLKYSGGTQYSVDTLASTGTNQLTIEPSQYVEITVDSNAGGVIIPSVGAYNIVSGENTTIFISPNKGHYINSVKVNDVNYSIIKGSRSHFIAYFKI